MPQLLMKYEKGKLCESRGRKVTDLTGKNPMMAGPPDNATRINRTCDLTRTEYCNLNTRPAGSVLFSHKEEPNMNTNIQAILTISAQTLSAAKKLQGKKIGANYSAKLCIYRSTFKPRINANPPTDVKQMHAMLFMVLFFISMVLVPRQNVHAATQLEDSSVKWHPGHYYAILNWGKNDPTYLAQVYREIQETPALRGIQIRYNWAELEKEWGVYDFTSIDQRLSELAALEKRLVILLDTKTYDTDTSPVPDYVKKKWFEWGTFMFSRHNSTVPIGYSTKLWNPHVHDRLVELIRRLGQRYNAHPYFEGIGLSETSMGQPLNALSFVQEDNYYNNLLSLNQHMRQHFPNTMTFQNTNYPRQILEQFTNTLTEMGAGLAVPDVFIEDPGLIKKDKPNTPDGIYSYFQKLTGIVPLTPSVMPKNYTNTRHDGTGYDPTVWELLRFARNNLKANYIFWTRVPDHYEEVLQVLNWRKQTSDPAGGLDPVCPAAYSSCINIVGSH